MWPPIGYWVLGATGYVALGYWGPHRVLGIGGIGGLRVLGIGGQRVCVA